MSLHSIGSCRACGASIRWVVMAETGNRNPLNLHPDDDKGNVWIDKVGVGHVANEEQRTQARERKYPLFLSHFATCPEAARFKKAKVAPIELRASFPDGWTCGPIDPCVVCGRGAASRDPQGRVRHPTCGLSV